MFNKDSISVNILTLYKNTDQNFDKNPIFVKVLKQCLR